MASSDKRFKGYSRSVRRNAALAKLVAQSGGRLSIHKARKIFADPERSAELDQQFQLRTAQQVTETFGNMKGAIMKIGQMASYLDTGLPDAAKASLATLQKDAPPMSYGLIRQQLEAELGAPPEEVFNSFNPNPLASASIGQVHAAITHDGDPVAVKVQYPKIDEAVRSDLKKADWLFGAMRGMFPGLDPEPIVTEIRDRLTEELDYVHEAAHQATFAKHFDGHPYIHIPKVFSEYSTKHVLCTELVVGSDFDTVLTWSQEEKNALAETLFRFSFGAIYQLNSFNGDPHPGNYIFEGDGKVAFLDFGLIKKFSESETKLFEDLIKHMVLDPNPEAFIATVADVGILTEESLEHSQDHIIEYFEYFYDYVMKDEPYVISETYSADGVSRLFDMKGEFGTLMKTLNVPPSLVVVQRITLGLMGIFGQLRATANWQAISKELWPFVDAEPSTPMGEEIQLWEQHRT